MQIYPLYPNDCCWLSEASPVQCLVREPRVKLGNKHILLLLLPVIAINRKSIHPVSIWPTLYAGQSLLRPFTIPELTGGS